MHNTTVFTPEVFEATMVAFSLKMVCGTATDYCMKIILYNRASQTYLEKVFSMPPLDG